MLVVYSDKCKQTIKFIFFLFLALEATTKLDE